MKIFLTILMVLAVGGCATAVAVVDVTASTAIYATKTVVTTTYDVVTYPFKGDDKK